MSKKAYLVILLIVSLFVITSCQSEQTPLPQYTYENKVFEPSDWNKFEIDSSMEIDGVLDEEVWAGKNAYSFSNPSETNTMSVKTHFGENGVYFGIEVEDTEVYINTDRLFWKNDSIELYINPQNNVSGPNSTFAQIRVDANNNIETWVGVKSPDGYPWSKLYLPLLSKVVVDGKLNSSETNGYTVELFLPYDALLLEAKPEKIAVLPAFVDSTGLGQTEFSWNAPIGASHTSVGTYTDFDQNGLVQLEEGSLFGDYNDVIKYTKGFDLSEEQTKVSQNGAGDQFVYFKDVHSSKYMFSVNLSLKEVYNNDNWPKAGVIVGDNGTDIVTFFFDPLKSLTQKTGLFVTGKSVGDRAWQWGNGIGLSNEIDYSNVKLTVIRNENDVYVLVDDVLLTKVTNLLTGDSTPGLFTMNLSALYTNYEITENSTEIDAKITNILRPQGTVFGDSEFGKLATAGFDISNDNVSVSQTGGADQWTYFKDVFSTKYMFSTDVVLGDRLNNDGYPKVGVILGENEQGILDFFLDPFPAKNNYYGVFVPKYTGGSWQWGPGSPLPLGTDYSQAINLKVIRDGANFYMLVNGVVVDYRYLDTFGASQPGLFTMNHEATYSNYTVTLDTTLVDTAAAQARSQFLDNEMFENKPAFQGSVGFDLSNSETSITQNLGQDKVTYFKGINGEQYMFTTTIELLGVLNNDNFPKAGVIIGDNGTNIVTFFFDPLKSLQNKAGMIVTANSDLSGWQWPGTAVTLSNELDYSNAKVTVIRNFNEFYILINDELVYEGVDLITGNSKPGLITMNLAATYSLYSVTTDETEILSKIDSLDDIVEEPGEETPVEGPLGNAPDGRTATGGYDLSQINDGVVTQSLGGDQFIYFTDINSTKYMIEASFLMGLPVNDAFPKIGLLAAENSTGRLVFLADTRVEKFFKDVMAVYQVAGGGWDWPGLSSYNGGINYDEYVHLKVIRDGETFYFFVNGQYMFDKKLDGYTDASVAGLFTMGMQSTFTNFSATTDETIINQELSNVLINNTELGWHGEGDVIVNSADSITFEAGSANVRESDKVIYKDGVTLSDNFFVEYKVSDVTVSQDIPGWMWPKLSMILVNENNERNYIGIGAATKQMRLETMVDGGWKNGIDFPVGTDLTTTHTIRVERIINPDNTATLNIYFDGVLQTFDGVSRTTNYTGSYTLGFTGDYAAGNIFDITYGDLQ